MKWSGAKKYDIGGEVSQHLSTDGAGREFLRQHLVGESPQLADLGCWTGRNLPVLFDLAGPKGKVYGVDGPWAREAVKKIAGRVVVKVEATLSSLPFANGQLDGALCWRVLHNLGSLEELVRALNEIHRVLRPGSPLVVAVRAGEDDGLVPKSIERSNGNRGVRRDLYFSRTSLVTLSGWCGFQIHASRIITEGEVIDGRPVINKYWVVHWIALP